MMQAYSYELYQILGIFLPLITTNCIILGRADAFARKNALPAALYDGFIMGIGFGAVLVLLGAIRELLDNTMSKDVLNLSSQLPSSRLGGAT